MHIMSLYKDPVIILGAVMYFIGMTTLIGWIVAKLIGWI